MTIFTTFILGILAFPLVLGAQESPPEIPVSPEPVACVFFDLGNTLVDTRNINEIRYFPQTRAYINTLKAMGFCLGLIVNIPEQWGQTYDEKLRTLISFIDGNWIEEDPFDWQLFTTILLPRNDEERKPQPVLFERALNEIMPCPFAYISETQAEVDTANNLGIAAMALKSSSNPSYVPTAEIVAFIKASFTRPYDPRCFDTIQP